MAPEFRPGTFEPVITVAPRSDGFTRSFHGDKTGLLDGCEQTFRSAFSASSAGGTNTEYNRASMTGLSKVLAQFLWSRQLSNQLGSIGMNDRYKRSLCTDFALPEPIVKLFNCYGHVEHEDVKYTQLDLEREYAWALVDLAFMVKDLDWDDENPTVHDPHPRSWVNNLTLDTSGQIQMNTQHSVRVYVNTLVRHISGLNIDPEYRLRLLKNIIDVGTERDLAAAMRWLRQQPDLGQLPNRGTHARNEAFNEYIQQAFGNDTPNLVDGSVTPRVMGKIINRVAEGLRHVMSELFTPMAMVPLPRYEKGSLAQLSETTDDLTFTHFPLSLADLTVTAAFKVGKCLRRFLRASPELTDSQLRADLIQKSIRRRA